MLIKSSLLSLLVLFASTVRGQNDTSKVAAFSIDADPNLNQGFSGTVYSTYIRTIVGPLKEPVRIDIKTNYNTYVTPLVSFIEMPANYINVSIRIQFQLSAPTEGNKYPVVLISNSSTYLFDNLKNSMALYFNVLSKDHKPLSIYHVMPPLKSRKLWICKTNCLSRD